MFLIRNAIRDDRGFSQITFSVLAMFFLLLIAGLASDMERLRLVQGNLVVACDAGSLSGAMTADVMKDVASAPEYDKDGNLIGIKEDVRLYARINSLDRAKEKALSAFVLNGNDLTDERGVSFDSTGDLRGEVVGTDDSYKVSARARVRTFFAGAVGLLTGNRSFLSMPVSAAGTARAVVETN